MPYTKEEHKQTAQQMPRDNEGHFAKKPTPSTINNEPSTMNPVSKFLSDHTTYSKNQDDLLNIHIGNPLRKLVSLLEDIKKQKAFSFTLKGSLGLVGVVVALSLFGIFGTDKLFCNKGIQSQVGVIKVLNFKEERSNSFLSQVPILNTLYPIPNTAIINRIVLVKKDDSVIKLENIKSEEVTKFSTLRVIVTGNYDSCSESLKIPDTKSIELYY